MRKFLKGVAVTLLVAAVAAGGGRAAFFAYREARVRIALNEAKNFVVPDRTPPRVWRDPPKQLRPPLPDKPERDPKLFKKLAEAYDANEKGDCDRVIAIYSELLTTRLRPDFEWLFLRRRGDCYLKKKESQKAMTDYDRAERLGGLTSAVYVTRAWAWRQMGKKAEALKDFESAIATSADDTFIYYNRAAAFLEDNDLEHAIADYNRVLELAPRDFETRLACADLYLRRGDNTKAIIQSTVVMNRQPKDTRPYLIRAKAYAQLGMKSRALADLDTMKNLKADPVATLNAIAWVHATAPQAALQDGAKAVASATTACEMDHWSNWTYVDTLGAAYAEAGKFEAAVNYQQLAIKMASEKLADVRQLTERLQLYKQHKPFRDE